MRYPLLFLFGMIALMATAADVPAQALKKRNPPIWSDQKDAFGDPLPIGAIARIGTLRYRVSGTRQPDLSVLSPDGKLLAIPGVQGEIEIWELPAWKRHRLIVNRGRNPNNTPQFQGLDFSADSKTLAAFDFGERQQICLFDVATGKLFKSIPVPKKETQANISLVKLSRDGQRLVLTLQGNLNNVPVQEVFVWDLGKDKLVQSFNIPLTQNGMIPAISADGCWLTLGVIDPNPMGGGDARSFIEVWNLTTGTSARKTETDMPLSRLAFSPDGKWLAACDGQSVLRFYDGAGKEKHNIRLRRAEINHLEFSPDSASVYLARLGGQIQRYDVITGERSADFTAPTDAIVHQFALPRNGKMLALAYFGNAFHFWEVATGKVLSPTGLPGAMIDGLSFSPKGELFVGSEDNMLAWWNPRTAVKRRDLKLEARKSSDSLIPLPYADGNMYFLLRRERGDTGPVTLSPGGDFLVVHTGDNTAFYDAKTGKLLYDDMPKNRQSASVIGFFDGDAKVASILNQKVRVWNARTGRDLAHFNIPLRADEQSLALHVSPNGKYFAIRTAPSAGGENAGRLLFWDAVQKKIVSDLPIQTNLDTVVFSPDNQWLVLAGPQDAVQLVRVGSTKAIHELKLGRDEINISRLVFSPDGRQLACAGVSLANEKDASRIFIYEMASKKIRLQLVGHPTGIIERLAYSHDGGLLATGATDTTVLVWNAGLRAFAAPPTPLPKGEGSSTEATDDDLAYWFQQMAGTNAKAAFRNMIRLAQTPKQAVKLLEAKIAPTKRPDPGPKTVSQWIDDLGSNQFPVRSKASAMLQKIGGSVEPDLRAALPRAKDIEMKRRIEEILERIASHEWTPEEVLHARAVEVAEAIASAEARALLTRWTTGDPAAVLTTEARKALARLR